MSSIKYFFAVDLGATSGRTIIGRLSDGKISLEELTRFENSLIRVTGHYYWDIFALYQEIIKGLRLVARRDIPIESIGIDSWGCDFVCVGADGQILRNPLSYRDPHTFHTMGNYFEKVIDRETVYRKTGIQLMNFNSLFQLYQMRLDKNTALANASKVLFTPDALTYMLTGKAVCEYTISSTSQLLNPVTSELDSDLLKSVGLSHENFGSMIRPGSPVGVLTEEVQKQTGVGAIPVIAVAGHDTGSAVAAVPAENERFAYLSSGTWSLMGVESPHPIINDKSLEENFSNEGGIEGTTRFLKNICGMWIYERCRKESPEAEGMSHPEIQEQAIQCKPFRSLINPDDSLFVNPESMRNAIDEYCTRTGQPVPQNYAEYNRCIFDSLALRYRQVFGLLREFADFPIDVLHVIGGGSKNYYLDQFTANSCNVTVYAGPEEGTTLGNIMLQAKAGHYVSNIWEMRSMIARSVKPIRFDPCEKERWDEAYEKYITVTSR